MRLKKEEIKENESILKELFLNEKDIRKRERIQMQ